jgi:ankyrin repeat protein
MVKLINETISEESTVMAEKWTALLSAIYRGNLDTVKSLLKINKDSIKERV